MMQASAPPAPPPADVVVARSDHSAVTASLDLPLAVTRAGRREDLVVRRGLFVTASVSVVRPAAGGDARYRWTVAGYLQRQYCVHSLTGVFACTTPDVEALPDKAQGEAPLAKADDFPLAAAAEQMLAEDLKARATAVFDADRRAVVEPMLKAASVTTRAARR